MFTSKHKPNVNEDSVRMPVNCKAIDGVTVGTEDEEVTVERLENVSDALLIMLDGKEMMTDADPLTDELPEAERLPVATDVTVDAVTEVVDKMPAESLCDTAAKERVIHIHSFFH